MVRTAAHSDLRKRNQAFANKAGKSNPLRKVDPLDARTKGKGGNNVPKWLVFLFLALLAGGLFFEIGQLVLDIIWPPVKNLRAGAGARR